MKAWAKSLVWLPVLCVSFASCGDDAKKNVERGNEGGEGGAPPDPSAGGSDVNPTAGVGAMPVGAGAGGTGEGGTGPVVAGGAGGVGGEGGSAELVCFQPAPGGGGAGGDPYGGAQWKDFAANTCRPCPAADLVCDDLVLDPAATYDHETGVLTLHVAPGKSEVVSADFLWQYFDGQAYQSDTSPAQVNANTLTIQVGPFGALPSYISGDLTVRDGCGDENLIGQASDDWFELQRFDPATGGAGGEAPITYEIRCQSD